MRSAIILLALFGCTPVAASAQTTREPAHAFRRLGLPLALIQVAGGDEATARRLLGRPGPAGPEDQDWPMRALFYRRAGGYEIIVILCGRETAQEFRCRNSRAASPNVYEVVIRRRLPDEAAVGRFEALAHTELERASVRTWRECDTSNYDLAGGATATVEFMSGTRAIITLFRTPPPRSAGG